ncbi:MAG: hypothetical protein NT022_08585 [Deltaproteobacteria bacterium]|nr:hypothetical protein [Deltaproteobacteria bacterium]
MPRPKPFDYRSRQAAGPFDGSTELTAGRLRAGAPNAGICMGNFWIMQGIFITIVIL